MKPHTKNGFRAILATVIMKSANEIPSVGDILQPFQFEPGFTAAEIPAKNT